MFFGFSIMKNNATKLFASWISHFCLSCVSFGTLYFEFPWVSSWKWKWVADDTWSATFFLKDRNSVWKSNQPQWSINKQGNRYIQSFEKPYDHRLKVIHSKHEHYCTKFNSKYYIYEKFVKSVKWLLSMIVCTHTLAAIYFFDVAFRPKGNVFHPSKLLSPFLLLQYKSVYQCLLKQTNLVLKWQ